MTDATPRPRARSWAGLVALVAVGLAPLAQAHAYLEATVPAAFATVADVTEVVLTFDGDVEAAFSRFWVVRLELPDDAWPADPTAPTDGERRRVNALAAVQVREATPGTGVALTAAPLRRTTEVRLALDVPLAPGAYAVTFDVLAVDGHTTGGHVVFFVGAD